MKAFALATTMSLAFAAHANAQGAAVAALAPHARPAAALPFCTNLFW